MSLVSFKKQVKMSFISVSFKKEVGESGESKKQAKMSFISVSFQKEIGESGESLKTSKNEFHFCEL